MIGKDNSSLRFTLGHSCEGRTRVGWRSPGASMISLMFYSLCCITDMEAVSVPFPVLVSRSEKRWWNKVKAHRMRLLKFSSVFAVMTMSAKNKWNKQTNKQTFVHENPIISAFEFPYKIFLRSLRSKQGTLATMNSHLLSKGSWFYFCIKHFLFSKTAPFDQFSVPAASITPQNGKFLQQRATLGPQQLLSGNSLVYYCIAE